VAGDGDVIDGGDYYLTRRLWPDNRQRRRGIAVMSNLPKEVRQVTDELDCRRQHHESG